MAADGKMVLYSYFRSSCSWRVRIALAHKGIPHEYRGVNLLRGEHLEEDYLRLNPSAEVPALVHDGNVLTHSTAILEYLEEIAPGPPLLPADPVSRARVRALVDCVVSDIQPLQNMRVLRHVGEKSSEWGRHWIEKGFASLEGRLRGAAPRGQYCCGDAVTLADLCLVPQVFNARRFGVDVEQKFPLIHEISSRLEELPAFRVSHPLVQPDCPEELRRK